MIEIKQEEESITSVLGELENILATFENPVNDRHDDNNIFSKKRNKIIDDNKQSDKNVETGDLSCQFCDYSSSNRNMLNRHC